MKKILSVLLSTAITLTMVCDTTMIRAEDHVTSTPETHTIETEYSIKGTNSFGKLFSDEISAEKDKQEENNGCNVFSAEVNGKTVSVEYETTERCTLLAAIYDETGSQLIASGTVEVSPEETSAEVKIETEKMPEYFYLKVFMINTITLKPMCTVYGSPNYTKEMQEFFAKTVDNFEPEKVFNIGEDKTNNFAVFGDNTKVIVHSDTVNTVQTADEENEYYVIENADSTVTSLQPDDIFTYEYDDETLLIVKVGTISVDGTTVTITGQDTDMEEVFQYVKIDSTKNNDAPSEQYENFISDNNNSAYITGYEYQALEGEKGESVNLNVPLADKELIKDNDKNDNIDYNLKFSGSIDITITGSIKYYITWNYAYLELKLDYKGKIEFGVSGSVKGKMPLIPKDMPIGISPIPGVFIEMTPSLILELSASIKVNASISGTIGISCDSEVGKKNLTKGPKVEILKPPEFVGTLFLGVSFEPKIKIISDKVAKASLDARMGFEIKGKSETRTPEHDCDYCINGDISGKYSLVANVTLGNKKAEEEKPFLTPEESDKYDKKMKWSFKFEILNITAKLFDWYISFTHDKFGFGTCPYSKQKVTIQVRDPDGKPVSGAEVNFRITSEISGKTDVNGNYELLLNKGNYYLWVWSREKNMSAEKDFTVDEKSKTIVVNIVKNDGSGFYPETPITPTPIEPDDMADEIIDRGTCGENVNWELYENGLLIISGIGNITDTDLENFDNDYGLSFVVHHFQFNDKIKSIIIKNGVTSIGDDTFSNCTSLESVTIPDSVTSIGDRAFSFCISLKSIKIPDSVTSIGYGAFSSCESLESITIPNSLIEIGSNAFSCCTSLESITIPNSVTEIGSDAFYKCTNLSSVTIPNSVIEIGGYAFYKCTNLSSVTIPDSVTSIGDRAFSSCISLKSINIPDSVTSIGYGAFSSCESLESITIPNSVTKIGSYAFYKCTNLSSVTIPDSVTSIGQNAFSYCTSLESITIPNSITYINYDAFFATGIKDVYYSGTKEQWDKIIYDEFFGNSNSNFTNATIHYNSNGISSYSDDLKSKTYLAGLPKRTKEFTGLLPNETETKRFFPIEASIPSGISAQSANMSNKYSLLSDKELSANINSYMNNSSEESYSSGYLSTNGIPNEIYNAYVVKSKTVSNLLVPDNLLYITQIIADTEGCLGFDYQLEEKYPDKEIILTSLSRIKINSADVTVSDILFNGSEQFAEPVVKMDDKTLEIGRDYDIEGDYSASVPGRYNISIIGCGEYAGSLNAEYNVYCEHSYDGGVCTICGLSVEEPTTVPTEPAAVKTGDIDGDGEITLKDAVLIRRFIVGGWDVNVDIKAADLDKDGEITLKDAVLIRRYIVGGWNVKL